MHTKKRKSGEMGMYGGAIYYICVGAVLSVAIQVLFSKGPTIGEANWWNAVGAVGTLGAATAATALGLRDGFRRRREALMRAKIAASQIYQRCDLLRIVLENYVEQLKEQKSNKTDREDRKFVGSRIAIVLGGTNTEHAIGLAGAPNDVATSYADMIAKVDRVMIALKEDSGEYTALELLESLQPTLDTATLVTDLLEKRGTWKLSWW